MDIFLLKINIVIPLIVFILLVCELIEPKVK